MKRVLPFLLLGVISTTGCLQPVKSQDAKIQTPPAWQTVSSTGTMIDVVTSTTTMPGHSTAMSSGTVVSTGTITVANTVDQNWWQHFQDPTLSALLHDAVQNNKNLAIAKGRVEEALANRGIARSSLYPQINGQLDASRGNAGANSFNTTIGEADALLNASWEIDLFGHNQARSAQAQALLQLEQANAQGVTVELLAEVARNYFDLRNEDRQITITQQNLEKEKRTLELINAQVQGALASQFDVQRAAAQVSSTESRLPALESDYEVTMNHLNVLLGVPPGTRDASLKNLPPTLPLDPSIVVAAPAAVLGNRPDVRMAERQFAATISGTRAAISDFFPRITLLGYYGVQTSNLYVLSPWSIGAQLVQPLINFGLLRSQYHVATARQSQAFNQYQETVLEALENMNNSLSGFIHEYDRNHSLSAAVDQNRKAADLSKLQFTSGYTDLLDVLVAERNELDAESALATSDSTLRKNLVNIYTAAGGGWDTPTK